MSQALLNLGNGTGFGNLCGLWVQVRAGTGTGMNYETLSTRDSAPIQIKCSTLINYLIGTKRNLWHQP